MRALGRGALVALGTIAALGAACTADDEPATGPAADASTTAGGSPSDLGDRAEGPEVDDHWHAAFAIAVCGEFEPSPPQSPSAPSGIHTHGDGLMHIHPSPDHTGDRATVGELFASLDLGLTDGALTLPIGRRFENGDECPDGRSASLRLVVWDDGLGDGPPDAVLVDDLAAHVPRDGEAFTLAFGADDAVERPPAVRTLESYVRDDPDPPSTSSEGSPEDGVEPDATAAPRSTFVFLAEPALHGDLLDAMHERAQRAGLDVARSSSDPDSETATITLRGALDDGDRAVLAAPGLLAFRPVLRSVDGDTGGDGDAPAPAESGESGEDVLVGADGRRYAVGPVPAGLDAAVVDDAEARISAFGGRAEWTVELTFSESGLDGFNLLAQDCFERAARCPSGQVAIVVDETVLSAPVVRSPSFDDVVVISGGEGFDRREASALAATIATPLPEGARLESASASG